MLILLRIRPRARRPFRGIQGRGSPPALSPYLSADTREVDRMRVKLLRSDFFDRIVRSSEMTTKDLAAPNQSRSDERLNAR